MKDLAQIERRVNDAQLRSFGESVILPSGDVVTGVFSNGYTSPFDNNGAMLLGVPAQSNPTVQLRVADASGLSEKDRITIGGSEFIVTRVLTHIDGLSEVQLMPDKLSVRGPVWR